METSISPESIAERRTCYHGGAFWDGIGVEFDELDRRDLIINADVLDAWFDPAPAVMRAVASCLPFALKTSPPTNAEGLRRVIASERGVAEDAILPGAGSSDLIFSGLRQWINRRSRVLILDPMYGEYAHVLERVIGARVDRFPLSRAEGYVLRRNALSVYLARGYDWVVLVNPNSPTGHHVPRHELESMLAEAPQTTRFWIDETYVDYAGENQSIETFAALSDNVVVCKSMSKAYALSGARVGYLCGPGMMIDELASITPPWAVSLPAQIAACAALRADDYYRARWIETRQLRQQLSASLEQLGWRVLPGSANFLLCHLPDDGPTAASVVDGARARGLFIREVANMGRCFDAHTLRVAVKDAPTNRRMVEILTATIRSHAVGESWTR